MKYLLFLLAALAVVACKPQPPQGRQAKYYQSPMHPWVTSDKPGNCTICGMALVPVYEGEPGTADSKDVLPLGQRTIATLGIATTPVEAATISRELRLSGTLEDDENLHRIVAAFYDGRIEKVYVDHVGQVVRAGEPLAAIYSPDLLYVVREYQNAVKGGDKNIALNSARRLLQYGLSSAQVEALAKTSENVYTIDLLAPSDGVVVLRNAYKGQYIKTGEPLFETGNLARLWFHAEVYERDLPDIRLGQKAKVFSPAAPGREFEGEVTFIDPNFDPATRTTKVRIEVDNPLSGDPSALQRVLPHRAYAEAFLKVESTADMVLPRSAVLRDGRREVVYLERDKGKYEQRHVRTGRVGDNQIQVLEGLSVGDRVVTAGNLFIDAETQLRGGPVEAPITVPEPVIDFLTQLASASDALAADNFSAASDAMQHFAHAASTLKDVGTPEVDVILAQLRHLPAPDSTQEGAKLRASFLPWATAGADLALALKKSGVKTLPIVFECPMTSESFPGAPASARWVQTTHETRNPYFGAGMIACGSEVQP